MKGERSVGTLERCLASSFASHATPGARLACEADIEDVAGSRVWLRRTSREAALHGFAFPKEAPAFPTLSRWFERPD